MCAMKRFKDCNTKLDYAELSSLSIFTDEGSSQCLCHLQSLPQVFMISDQAGDVFYALKLGPLILIKITLGRNGTPAIFNKEVRSLIG